MRRNNKDEGSEKKWIMYRELAPSAQVYPKGSERTLLRKGASEEVLNTIRLGFDSAITTDGAGALATVVSNSPVQAQNWANYAAVFDSYRVLAMILEFDPFWTVNCTFAPVASVVDRSDSTALTSYGLAERYESSKKTPGQKRFRQYVNMSGSEEALFKQTSAPVADNWIKLYSSGNTASFTLARLNVVLIVQFRGVGIN